MMTARRIAKEHINSLLTGGGAMMTARRIAKEHINSLLTGGEPGRATP